jgi:hypothetical protein
MEGKRFCIRQNSHGVCKLNQPLLSIIYIIWTYLWADEVGHVSHRVVDRACRQSHAPRGHSSAVDVLHQWDAISLCGRSGQWRADSIRNAANTYAFPINRVRHSHPHITLHTAFTAVILFGV